MRILIIGRTYILEANRSKWNFLPEHIELAIVTPRKLSHTLGTYSLEPSQRFEHFVVEAVGTRRLSGFLLNPFSLWRVIGHYRPHLIQVDEEPASPALLEAIHAGHHFGCPVIFFSWENLPMRYRWPISSLHRINLQLADGAIAGTCEAAAVLKAAGFSKPMAVIPQLGVDPDLFKRKPRAVRIEKLRENTFTVGFIGRLVPEKGLWVLLEALTYLGGSWQLLLVGDGPIRQPWLEEARRRRLADHVIWVPTVPHLAVPDYLNAIDVLVLPSLTTPRWKEQFGHVLIEAMACEVPVIGSDSGAIPEVLGEGGIVVPEGDAHALAQAINLLRSSESERRRLGRQGRMRVLEHYTNERICAQTVNFWREILNESQSVR